MKVLQSTFLFAMVISGTVTIELISNTVNAQTIVTDKSQLEQSFNSNCNNNDHERHDQNSHPPKKPKS